MFYCSNSVTDVSKTNGYGSLDEETVSIKSRKLNNGAGVAHYTYRCMAYPTIFHLISAIEKKEGVRCILIGGFAVNYHKVTRQTLDVDFAIAEEDFRKISAALKKAGFKLDFIHKTFARFKANDYYLTDIDFMFVDKETFSKIIKDAKTISIAKQKFMVPSLSTLLAMKLHAIKSNRKAREYKDIFDILSLIRANNLNYKSEEFKGLCLKYGTEELYQKIASLM